MTNQIPYSKKIIAVGTPKSELALYRKSSQEVKGYSNVPTGYRIDNSNTDLSSPALIPLDTCIYCKKELIPSKGKPKFYCNKICCQSYHYHNNPMVRERILRNAIKSRNRYKDNPEWKAKRVKMFAAWRAKNIIKHNEQMKLIQRRKFKEARAKGLCYLCRVTPSIETYCDICKIKRREYNEARKIAKSK